MKFRKKPVVVEAVKWTGKNRFEMIQFCHDLVIREEFAFGDLSPRSRIYIETLEGQMAAEVGDWIVKGVEGEFYPCKPAIFVKTYEPV